MDMDVPVLAIGWSAWNRQDRCPPANAARSVEAQVGIVAKEARCAAALGSRT